MAADLSRTATLDSMIALRAPPSDVQEAGGGVTDEREFEGRNGFDRAFLPGWRIELPRPTGAAADDVCVLRQGGTELTYRNFSTLQSKARRLPVLAACNIDGSRARTVPRVSSWKLDGRLAPDDQWGPELYRNNRLDRGHMVRRLDPVWGTLDQAQQANRDTFHYTVCCPQMDGMNQTTWRGLEDHILLHAKADGMRVSVFTGPYLTQEDPTYRDAQIPQAYWKVVAIVTDDGRPSATAYRIGQDESLSELEYVFGAYKTYQVSVQSVARETNIDFSPLVPYHGFSTHESGHGDRLEVALDSLDAVRV